MQNKISFIILIALCSGLFGSYLSAQESSFKVDYDAALANYWKVRQTIEIKEIAKTFQQLSSREDAGLLKANAFYWEGECWFRINDYLQALQAFERVLVITDSYKEEAARYMVTSCYVRLGRTKAARWEAERFLRDYPKSDLRSALKKELKRLKD